MKWIGIILIAPFTLLMVWRLFDGMFNKDDPDRFWWWITFLMILFVIGIVIMIFNWGR